MEVRENLLIMQHPESISAKLERIACDYRRDIEVVIHRINTHLESNLNELVEEFGYYAVNAAVDASDGDLSINDGQYSSIYEAFDSVSVPEPD
jgi:hypothetical protein